MDHSIIVSLSIVSGGGWVSGESGKKEDKYEHCYQLSAKCSSQDKQRWQNNERKVQTWQMWKGDGLAGTTILQAFTFLAFSYKLVKYKIVYCNFSHISYETPLSSVVSDPFPSNSSFIKWTVQGFDVSGIWNFDVWGFWVH